MVSQATLDLQIVELNTRIAALRAQYTVAEANNETQVQKSLEDEISQLTKTLSATQVELNNLNTANTSEFNAPAGDTNIQNYTPTPVTNDPATDPNTNIGQDTTSKERKAVADDPAAYDPNTNVGADTTPKERKAVADDPAAYDPNTNVGADTPREVTQGTAPALTKKAQDQTTVAASTNFNQTADWRVRLSLGPGANYLYKVGAGQAGILNPLQATNGVIFPYTPSIQINYAAHYDSTDVAQTNYKVYQYKNSSVDNIQISCDFTAQDTAEANYMVAVIHFLRSVTKMFYGQDPSPRNGTPPPLCYLSGLGAFQFDNHPLVITGFNYNLPNEVDYIRAASALTPAGVNLSAYQYKVNTSVLSNTRMNSAGLSPGGVPKQPQFQNLSNTQATYVPTKMTIALSCIPMVSRYDISKTFSLKDYATGKLLKSNYPYGGGMW